MATQAVGSNGNALSNGEFRLNRGRRPAALGERKVIVRGDQDGGSVQLFQRKTSTELANSKTKASTNHVIPASRLNQKNAVVRAADTLKDWEEPTWFQEKAQKLQKRVCHPWITKGFSALTAIGATYLFGGFHWAGRKIQDGVSFVKGGVSDATQAARNAAGSAKDAASVAAGEVTGAFTGLGGAALGTVLVGGMALGTYAGAELVDSTFDGKEIGSKIKKGYGGAALGTLAAAGTTAVLLRSFGSPEIIAAQTTPLIAAIGSGLLASTLAGSATTAKTAAAVSSMCLFATAAGVAALSGEHVLAGVPGTAAVATGVGLGVIVAGELGKTVIKYASDLAQMGKTVLIAGGVFGGAGATGFAIYKGGAMIREPVAQVVSTVASPLGSLLAWGGKTVVWCGKYLLTTLRVAETAQWLGSCASSTGSAVYEAGASALRAIAPTASYLGSASVYSGGIVIGAGAVGSVAVIGVEAMNEMKSSAGIDRTAKALGAAGAGAVIGACASGALSGIAASFAQANLPAEYGYIGIVGALTAGVLTGIAANSPRITAATTASLAFLTAVAVAADETTLATSASEAAGVSLMGLGLGTATVVAAPLFYGAAHASKAAGVFMLQRLESCLKENKNLKSHVSAPKKLAKRAISSEGEVQAIDYTPASEPVEYNTDQPAGSSSRRVPRLTRGEGGGLLRIGQGRTSRRDPLAVRSGRGTGLLKNK